VTLGGGGGGGIPRKEAPAGDFRVLGVRWGGGVARSSVANFRLGTHILAANTCSRRYVVCSDVCHSA